MIFLILKSFLRTCFIIHARRIVFEIKWFPTLIIASQYLLPAFIRNFCEGECVISVHIHILTNGIVLAFSEISHNCVQKLSTLMHIYFAPIGLEEFYFNWIIFYPSSFSLSLSFLFETFVLLDIVKMNLKMIKLYVKN